MSAAQNQNAVNPGPVHEDPLVRFEDLEVGRKKALEDLALVLEEQKREPLDWLNEQARKYRLDGSHDREAVTNMHAFWSGVPCVKFIVWKDDRDVCHVLIGAKDFKFDVHRSVAIRNKISLNAVVAGGIADIKTRRISGKSVEFGPYDCAILRQLLPDWQIDPPSNY